MTETEKANILLVDDQESRLLSYQAILGDLGQNLVTARGGMEALDRLMKDEYAVILLDVSMPGMDGFETATLIHQHPRFENTPIIFVTAFHMTDLDRLKGYELGAVDYVYVPVVPMILRSKVAVLVELHTKRRELQRANQRLEQANAELAAANSSLQAEKNRELEALNHALAETNRDLARSNESLQDEIDQRTRLEDVLRETDRRKDEFLAMLAHELRNPLAPVLNAAQIMRMKGLQDPDLARCRDIIERQSKHLARLVEDLLDVSRITQGKIKLRKEPLDVSTVVSRAVEATRPLMDARRQDLRVQLPGRPALVDGDLTRLAQVVGNLLNNASKYTGEGGRIAVVVEVAPDAPAGSPGEVLIRVRDSGVGIPAEMLPNVFDLFTQVERTLDRSEGGLGIGLALVDRLVTLHGGGVTAQSEGPGKGSEFTVRLPLMPTLREVPVKPAVPLQIGEGGGRRILVVDDNRDCAQSLALVLRHSGNVVETAFDGMQAVDVAESFRPDVILLDIGMPRLDGYSVARWLRAQAWTRNVLLIALTGWGQEDAQYRIAEAGFDAHMVKPVDFAVLHRILHEQAAADRCAAS